MFEYFSNKSIRNLVVSFGSLFNNLHIRRQNKSDGSTEFMRVPLAYGSKEKYLRRIDEGGSITNEDGQIVSMTLPRMSFEISSIEYDNARKRQTVEKLLARSKGSLTDSTDDSKLKYTYSEVPYDINFDLHIMTKFMDDGLQIIEQILPYFTPEFTVTINPTDLHTKTDIPIVLTNVTQEEDFEGDFDARRALTWTLSFNCKSYVYGRIRDNEVIRSIIAKLVVAQDSTVLQGVSSALLTGATAPAGGRTSGIPSATGGESGVVHSRIDIGITGPSGASSDASDYSPTLNIRVFGGQCGGPSGASGAIDIYGDIIGDI